MNERPRIGASLALTEPDAAEAGPRLAEIGFDGFAPYLMNRIMGRYNASLRDDLAALGLTTPKMRALAVLAVEDGQTIGRLAVLAVTEQSTLSRALDGLEADGLVRREPDSADSRATRIAITQQGRAAFERLWPTMRANHDRMFAGVGEEERDAFVATLQKMLRNIRRHDF